MDIYSKLLIEERPIIVVPSLVRLVGLERAVILQQIHFSLQGDKSGKILQDGHKYIWNSYKEWVDIYSEIWSSSSIKRHFLLLEESGILVSKQPLKDEWDRTKYYRIDYAKLEQMLAESKENDAKSFVSRRDNMLDHRRDNMLDHRRDNMLDHRRDNMLDHRRDNMLSHLLKTKTSSDTSSKISTKTSTNTFAECEGTREIEVQKIPFVNLAELKSEEDVLRAILALIPVTTEVSELISTSQEQVVCKLKHKVCTCLKTCEKDLLKIYNEVINILCSGAVVWAKESKFTKELICLLRTSKYSATDVIFCFAWGYKSGKFNFYAKSCLSIPKIIPEFLDLQRTGKLKDSLNPKPKFETSAQRTDRIIKSRDHEKLIAEAATEYRTSSNGRGLRPL